MDTIKSGGQRVARLRCKSLLTAAALSLALALAPALRAAELQVLAGGALAEPLRELAARYEGSSGNKIVIRFGTTPELIKMATGGSPFDLGVFPVDVLRDAAARVQFAAGPATEIARAGLGVAVRAGAVKPDIGTPEALRRTLLAAKSIATIPASATGTQILQIFELLGIGEAMHARIRAQPTPARIVQAVANGEAELGVFLTNVLTAPGLELVGPFPDGLQREVIFTAAVGAKTSQVEAARGFIAYLKTPAAVAALRAKGLTPG